MLSPPIGPSKYLLSLWTQIIVQNRREIEAVRNIRNPSRPAPWPRNSSIFFGFGKPPEKSQPSSRKSHTKRKQGGRKIQKHPVTSERLFIGNLAYSVKEDELQKVFEKAGKVKRAEVVTNRKTKRSKGFGFVTMESIEDAERAVSQLDGTSIQGREISVSGAKSDGQKEGRPERKKPSPEKQNDRSERRESRPRSERGESRDRRRSDRGRDGDRRRDGRGRGKKSSSGPSVVPMAVAEITTPHLSMSNLSSDFGESELEHLFAGVAQISSSQIVEGKAELEMASVEDAQTAVRLLDGKDFMGKTLSLSGKDSDS